MKKSKGQTVDLLYTNKKETNTKAKSRSKSKTNNKKNKSKKTQNNNNQRINLDNEIIIGLTPKIPEAKNKKTNKRKGSNNSKNHNKKAQKNINNTNKNASKIKSKNTYTKKQKTKRKINTKIIKWITIIILLSAIILLFMMSSVFNIKEIIVINNSKVSSKEVIDLSQLKAGVNMFKTTNGIIKSKIKSNAYIEDVKIKRNINGTITLDIKERVPTYMIKINKEYAYINNQGYVLEVSKDALKLPTITGFTTPDEEIKNGNRLIDEDLNKLNDINKIVESSKNTSLADIITKINVSDSMNYKITISSEGKSINLGDMSNLNIKLQMAGQIISNEKGKKGEIYFQDNSKKAIFREKVSR